MSTKADILQTIITHKHAEIRERQQKCSLETLQHQILKVSPTRGFLKVLHEQIEKKQTAIIAEIKKASPSKGVIRENFDPVAIAKSYAQHGAMCLSVLTDQDFFQGNDLYLKQAREACTLPVLRKDFIVDPYQVYETRALGADCLLLIVAALDDQQLTILYTLALELGLDVLIEVHDASELKRALALKPRLVGINNRNLKTFHVDLKTTTDLLEQIPSSVAVISESGIHGRNDILHLQSHGVYGFLIGESLMRAPDPGVLLKEYLN